MSNAPSVLNLVGDSRRFVFDNIDVLKDHAKIIFPLILLFELVNNLAKVFGMEWVALLTIVPILYLYACFALSWHRSSLMGPSSSHGINPFEWDSRNKGFILVFFAMVLVPFLVALIIGAMLGGAVSTHNNLLIAIVALIAIPLSIYMFIQLIRVSFMLPARSMDVKMSMEEARKTSRGLIWKILGAGFVVGIGFMLVIFLYALIVGLTVGVVTKGNEPSVLTTGLMSFILQIPVQVMGFIVAAINVTVLSKAYQWGMQNNS